MAAIRFLLFSRFSKSQNLSKHFTLSWLVSNSVFVRGVSVSTWLLNKTTNVKPPDSKSIKEDSVGHELRFGKVAAKLPARVTLEEGKLYSWCTCGLSKKQPFCDNSHRAFNEANPDTSLPPFRSHKFQVDKNKEYTLCNCKQTKNRPFCDGSHKQKSVQEALL